MKTSLFLLLGVLVVSGCDSEVVGGGGGAGGAGDGGATTAPATTSAVGTADSSAETGAVGTTGPSGTGGADDTTVSVGTGGGGTGGSENLLGNCEQNGGTASSSGSGGTSCDADFTCDAGTVVVTCFDDGTSETCECSLDEGGSGSGGTCDNTDNQGCGFPQSCCYELLGGHAEPNLGPYGACADAGGSSAQSGGGTTACGTSWTCDGGDMTIECEGDVDGALCECRDDQFFTIGTCRQATVDCEYETGCCYDIFNP